jgi:hypothetical protein
MCWSATSSCSGSVDYATSDNTALAGTDYTATSGTLSWADGDSSSRTISIPITSVAARSGNKAFALELSNPTNWASLGTDKAACVIRGSQSGAAIQLSGSAAAAIVSDSSGNITVTLPVGISYGDTVLLYLGGGYNTFAAPAPWSLDWTITDYALSHYCKLVYMPGMATSFSFNLASGYTDGSWAAMAFSNVTTITAPVHPHTSNSYQSPARHPSVDDPNGPTYFNIDALVQFWSINTAVGSSTPADGWTMPANIASGGHPANGGPPQSSTFGAYLPNAAAQNYTLDFSWTGGTGNYYSIMAVNLR